MYSGTIEGAPNYFETEEEHLLSHLSTDDIERPGDTTNELHSIPGTFIESEMRLATTVREVGYRALSETIPQDMNTMITTPRATAIRSTQIDIDNNNLSGVITQSVPLVTPGTTYSPLTPLIAEAPIPSHESNVDTDPFGFILTLQMLLLWMFLGGADSYIPNDLCNTQMYI